jgi:hypothetical protein
LKSLDYSPALVHVRRFHRQCLIRNQLARLSSRNCGCKIDVVCRT